MTSTGNATKTWTRKTVTENAHLSDDYYASHRGGRSFHYSNRDAKGRFVKATHVEMVERGMVPTFHDGNGQSHVNARCCAASGTVTLESGKPAGWLCSACVFVPNLEANVSRVTKDGEQECLVCEQTLPVTKFPTVHTGHEGATHRGHTCRACQAEARSAAKAKPGPWAR